MHRIFVLPIVSVLALAYPSFGQHPTITISVFGDVKVPDDVLLRAERQTNEIFSKAGVAITWTNCVASHSSLDSGCAKNYGPKDFVLRLTSHSSSAANDSAGIAFLGPDGIGRYADVFWNRVQGLSSNGNVRLDRILGTVMAHEMGHLLLGLNSHTGIGLMQARWTGDELRRIDMGMLLFLPDQAQRIRARIGNGSTLQAATRSGVVVQGQ